MHRILICLFLTGCSIGPLGWDADELMELGMFALNQGIHDSPRAPGRAEAPGQPGPGDPGAGERGPSEHANDRASETPAGDRARGRNNSGKRGG